MIQELIFLDDLSINSVNIRKQKYYTEDGQDPMPVGNPWRVAIINSERGRTELANQLQEPFFSAVMSIWGDTPTIVETEPETPIENE